MWIIGEMVGWDNAVRISGPPVRCESGRGRPGVAPSTAVVFRARVAPPWFAPAAGVVVAMSLPAP